MKELVVSWTLEDFTAQDYYSAIYAEPGAFERYHKEVSKDPNAKASAWESNARDVRFKLTMNVPQMLKKLIGVDTVSVVERQEITWHGKDKFVVTSVPTLNFPGSAKFTTKGHTTVTTVNGTCQVDAVMVCNAAMPWPMQGTVEATMAAEAEAGMNQFSTFCKTLCAEAASRAGTTEPVLAPATPPQVPPAAVETSEETEDRYYDAWDASDEDGSTSAQMLRGASGRRPGMQVGRPVASSGSHDVMLLASLRELQLSSQATAQALADVATQLKAMNENVAAIRAAVTGAGPGMAGRMGWQTGYGWMLLVAAGASAAGVMYVRSRQRTGQ